MINRIISYSLKNRISILIAATLLLISGLYVASTMDIDVFPELTAPTVVVMTQCSGMAPEEVERLVTFPIETAVNGSTGIRRVRSNSYMGFSIVWVEFDWKVDIYHARQTVTERLIQVTEQFPLGVSKPLLAPQASLLGEMMIVALESDTLSPTELRSVADWDIIPRLLSISGVSQVTSIGGEKLEYQVLADPYKMKYFNVSIDELDATCQGINENSTGGFINEYGNIYFVRGIARTSDPLEIGNSVIKINNSIPVRINDVAEVKVGVEPKIGDGAYRARDAVLLNIVKQPNINTVRLADNVEKAMADISDNFEGELTVHTDVYNQAIFIRTAVRNVMRALIEGGFYVVIILFIFLLNFRTTIISLVAIPLSILFSILILRALDLTINTMSLGGMAIAIGSLVDDAIIDVENVYKRLRGNTKLSKDERLPVMEVVYNASVEIRPSILHATFIIIVTFLPLFFLEGFEGRMLKPLGISFIVSLFASLVVALTLTPVLCSYLLTNEKRLQKKAGGTWIERSLTGAYRNSLKHALNHKTAILSVSVSLLILAVILLFTFGNTFLPPFNEGALSITVSAMPGISLDESKKIAKKAQEIMLSMPEVESVSCKTGRAELAEHSFGENVSEMDIPFELKERSRDEFLADVRTELNELPGVAVGIGQPITHRMEHMLSGTRANIAIKLFGDDLNLLYTIANNIKSVSAGIEGIGDINVEQQVETPQLKIKARREQLARYGITVNTFTHYINMALGGEKVSDVFVGERKFPLVVRYNDDTRETVNAIRNSMIDTYDGKKVPLSFVADIESSSGPYNVSRENVRRKVVVSVNVSGRDVGSVVNDIKQAVDQNITLPETYRVEYGGLFESARRATKRLMIASILAILIVFVILFQEFKNTKLALVILLNLPLALIGGVIAIALSSSVISIPTIIGFVTLFGIATRNGLLLITRYEALAGKCETLTERILKGSADRLNPILMTALTAALALIPLAMGGDKPGNEIQSPMAIVILGGLLSSTLLNIYVIPSVYYLINRKNADK